MAREIKCERCEKVRAHHARGLCAPCYKGVHRQLRRVGERFEGDADPPPEPRQLLEAGRKLERAKRELTDAKRQLKASNKRHDLLSEVREMLVPIVEGYRLKPVEAARKRRTTRKGVTLVASWADWHWGEIVYPDQVDHINGYSPEVAALRVEHLVDTMRTWIETYQQAGGVDELVILELGDMASGQHVLHPDSAQEYARIGKQVVDVAIVMAMAISELIPDVPKIRIVKPAGDNHTRSTHRPPTGVAGIETGWGSVLAELVAALLISQRSVSVEHHRSYKAHTTIAGQRWAIAHGHMMRGGGGQLGIPAYALKRMHDSTVSRSVIRARQAEGNRLATDVLAGIVKHTRIGHFHSLAIWGVGEGTAGIVPSLKGVDSYVVDSLERYSPAGQLLEAVHPEHGIIGQHVIDVQHINAPGISRYEWGALTGEGTAAQIYSDWHEGAQ